MQRLQCCSGAFVDSINIQKDMLDRLADQQSTVPQPAPLASSTPYSLAQAPSKASRTVFLPSDNQERILRGILDRVQMPDEPLPTFVAHMLGSDVRFSGCVDRFSGRRLKGFTPRRRMQGERSRDGTDEEGGTTDREHLRQLQLNDPVTGELLRMLEGKDESNAEELSQYVIQYGLLYFVDDKVSCNLHPMKRLKLYAPTAVKRSLIEYYHDHPMAGHLGMTKTIARLKL
ncbi:hypothetical protein DPX16_0098 [Anabarilius grahami]|uniref:Integrase zinc-binding domain-containing protein n=1 Tax=Anabarilius grahami TaxID=495550 RepID=A0A3N0XN72_ANAGA|nr:hypothetical protein DPX16_0098 [Anabarilius grahami]